MSIDVYSKLYMIALVRRSLNVRAGLVRDRISQGELSYSGPTGSAPLHVFLSVTLYWCCIGAERREEG